MVSGRILNPYHYMWDLGASAVINRQCLPQMQEGGEAPGEAGIYLLELLMRRGGCLFGSWENKDGWLNGQLCSFK